MSTRTQPRPNSLRDRRARHLLSYAAANPNGITIDDIKAELDTDAWHANRAIFDLRNLLGDSDTINFPCQPDPGNGNGRWLYRLVGTLDNANYWIKNRAHDAETRVRTQAAMLSSISRTADARTIQGRKIRLMERALTRLVEDLDALIDIM